MYVLIQLPLMIVLGLFGMSYIGSQSEHIELDDNLASVVITKALSLAAGFILFVLMLPRNLFIRSRTASDVEENCVITENSAIKRKLSTRQRVAKRGKARRINSRRSRWIFKEPLPAGF